MAEVDRCDVYPGLLGNGHGHQDVAGISSMEREFDRAITDGKERLVHLKGDVDRANHPKTRALFSRASGQVIWQRFGAISELTSSA